MAQGGEALSCSSCLELLEESETNSSGQSFCRECISSFCDGEEEEQEEEEEEEEEIYRCPQRTELVQESRADIHKNIQDREKDVELLKEKVKTINLSADQTVKKTEKIFAKLIRVLHQRSSELEKEVRSKQQTEVRAVRALQEKLEQEISELKKRDAELQQISVSTHSSIVHTGPGGCFEEVTAAVAELRDHLHKVLMEDWTKVCHIVERVDVLLPTTEPTTRAGFLKYSQQLTVDPNSAHRRFRITRKNKKVAASKHDVPYPDHPDRFTVWWQALSRQSVTGRCYWEVEWKKREVRVAVAYKSIRRAGSGNECGFGFNNKSWTLECSLNSYAFCHNNVKTPVPGPQSSRIGVYVDHTAGILSFYSVSETMTLLHRVNTTFTEPLHAGVQIYFHNTGDSAEFCKLARK